MNRSQEEKRPDADLASEDTLRRVLASATDMQDPPIPADVDQGVLRMIDMKAGQIRRRRILRRVTYTGAAAAVALILVGGLLSVHGPYRLAKGARTIRNAETAHNVDIVDAYLLARRLKGGGSVSLDQDHNGDGRVDFADVDALAQQAVAIRPGRRGKES